ncbi:MAG: hypothetical protein II601_04685 [Lachnospiraceae bacterium]|jgi:uncharacterized membrane protein|nr:hypothetical protein [Lachnospiraceae bacterium]MBQ6542053.1 hypothetical protein [Lachnospiraceae bacterium]MBQ7600878.1 hypothetical protein [Lachnospiraceae bacterium]MBR6977160.1 hypothetical protein [Lachnospiraceae bacterium]
MASNNLFAMTDRTPEFEQEDIQNNKVMSILAYIGPLVLVTIFAAKDSKSARFNANQGLVLLILEAAGSITFGIISAILSKLPFIRWIPDTLGWLWGVACTVLAVFGIVNAARGFVKELPIIGRFKILK